MLKLNELLQKMFKIKFVQIFKVNQSKYLGFFVLKRENIKKNHLNNMLIRLNNQIS